MKILRILLLAVLPLISLQAHAQRQPVPIVNYENLPTGRPDIGENKVRATIEAVAREKEWEVREIAPGRLLATLVVRGKHTVMTEIVYSATQYSLIYRDSVNMKYGKTAETGGAPGVIHPFYNRWVGSLKDGILLALNKA